MSRSYVVGLPVIVTVADDGTVTYEIDTAETGLAVGQDDENEFAQGDVAADIVAIDADHDDRRRRNTAFRRTVDAMSFTVDPNGLVVSHHADGRVLLVDEVEPGVVRVGVYPNRETDTPTEVIEFRDADNAVAFIRGHGFHDARPDDDPQPNLRAWKGTHTARPDDEPGTGNTCKDCGRPVTWIGPTSYDWAHAGM